jgi:hypothetical protein
MDIDKTKPREVPESFTWNVVQSIIIFPFGFLMCFLGPLIIIGIPLLLYAIGNPFLSIGEVNLEGNCPYCANQLNVKKGKDAVNCGTCKQRVLIKDGYYYKLKL